jgi:hypothetical protein
MVDAQIVCENIIFTSTSWRLKLLSRIRSELKGGDFDVHVIGDAKERRKILEAISEKFILGRNI